MSKDKREKLKKEAVQKVKEYLTYLSKKGFPIKEAYMYGSYARGDFKEFSDIDICVISPKFRRNWMKNEQYMWHQTRFIDARIEPIGYAPEDFEDALLSDVIREEGIKIV